MKKSHAFGALMVMASMAAIPCHAAYIDEGGSGDLRIIGKISKEENAAGMGRNVSVREAIRQVVPYDYSVRIAPGADSLVDKRVNWRGGRPWTEVFADIVTSVPELSAEVDIPVRLVTISASQASRVDKGQTANATSTWRIRNGDKLSETLASWGRVAGWQGVFWEASEMASEIDVSFVGSFEDAVTQTIEALNRHGVQLRVIFYGGNKVVRIVESK